MTTTPNRSRSVAGRVAIVSGAASGMGRATAMLQAKEGARVAVTDPAARDAWVRRKRKEVLRRLMTEEESARWSS